MSEAPQFTPGPWAVHDHRDLNGNWWIGPGQFDTIAEARMGHDDIPGDALANARLIAAAPDLYAAVEALLSADIVDATSEALEQANAALIKAQGPSQ